MIVLKQLDTSVAPDEGPVIHMAMPLATLFLVGSLALTIISAGFLVN
ncbi:MAG: hypothetical protein AB8B60_14150 [Sulfitobacter sp.]